MKYFGIIIAVVANLARWIFGRKSKPEDQALREVEAARRASACGDASAINTRHDRAMRRRKIGRLSVIGFLLVAGCASFRRPEPVVVPADREQVPAVRDGVKGWFVPSAVHAEHVEAVEILDQQQQHKRRPLFGGCSCK